MLDLKETPRIQVTIPVFSGNKIIGHNRIDLVVHTPDSIAIVELKRLRGALRQSPMAARMRAQVAGYAECWARIFPGQRAPRCFLLNVYTDADSGRECVEVEAVRACKPGRAVLRTKSGRASVRPDRLGEFA